MARSTPDPKLLSDCAVLFGKDYTISLELDLELIKRINKIIGLIHHYDLKISHLKKNEEKKLNYAKQIFILVWTILNIIKHNPIYIDSDGMVYFVIPVFIQRQLSILNIYIKDAIHKFTFLTIDTTKNKECPIFFKYCKYSYLLSDEFAKLEYKFLVNYEYYRIDPDFIRKNLFSIQKNPYKYTIENPIKITRDTFNTMSYYGPNLYKLSSKKNRPLSKKLWDKPLSESKPRRHKFQRSCKCNMCIRKMIIRLNLPYYLRLIIFSYI